MTEDNQATVQKTDLTGQAGGTVNFFASESKFQIHNGSIVNPMVCGEVAFSTIAEAIKKAEHTIDIAFWGLDIDMLLVRNEANTKIRQRSVEYDPPIPSGYSYALPSYVKEIVTEGGVDTDLPDLRNNILSNILLDHAIKRDVKIRIVGWKIADGIGGSGTDSWDDKPLPHSTLEFRNMLESFRKKRAFIDTLTRHNKEKITLSEDPARNMRRIWNHMAQVYVDVPSINATEAHAAAVQLKRLEKLRKVAENIDMALINGVGSHSFPSFHQKHIIVDIEHPEKATGFVMGHNLLPLYWDTTDHFFDQPRRKFTVRIHRDAEILSEFDFGDDVRYVVDHPDITPLHDVSSQVWGECLFDLNKNFTRVWERALRDECRNVDGRLPAPREPSDEDKEKISARLSLTNRRQPLPGRDAYRDALFQRFPHPETHPTQLCATYVIDGEDERDIRKLYVQAAENVQSYIYIEDQYFRDAVLLQEMVDAINRRIFKKNKKPVIFFITNNFQNTLTKGAVGYELKTFNVLKNSSIPFVLCKLKTNEAPHQDVYVHAKVLIVDDVFYTIGSANVNERSMSHDPELNIARQAPDEAKQLRIALWNIVIDYQKIMGEKGKDVLFKEVMSDAGPMVTIPDPIACLEIWEKYIEENNEIGNADHYDLWRQKEERKLAELRSRKLAFEEILPSEGSYNQEQIDALNQQIQDAEKRIDELKNMNFSKDQENMPYGRIVTYEPFHENPFPLLGSTSV